MFKILPIVLALCLMLLETYYSQNYAGIIGLGVNIKGILQVQVKFISSRNYIIDVTTDL